MTKLDPRTNNYDFGTNVKIYKIGNNLHIIIYLRDEEHKNEY